MKNIFKSIVFLLILTMIQESVTAQNHPKEKAEELLTGTWVFDYETSITNMEDNAKKMLAKTPSIQEKLESSYKNRQITFGADGSYLLHLADGKQVSGTWLLDSIYGNNIRISFQNQIENLSIMTLSASALVLKLENDGKAKPMFSIRYFIKKKY